MGLLQKFSRKKGPINKVEDIIANLKNILNTKKLFGSGIKQLGIGDYNEYKSHAQIVATIIEEIQENIELYEPRVKLFEINVINSDESFRIRFELKCAVISESKPIYIIFDSIFNDIMIEK